MTITSLIPGSVTLDDGRLTAGLMRADGSLTYLAVDLSALTPAEMEMDTLALLEEMDRRLVAGEPCAARSLLSSPAPRPVERFPFADPLTPEQERRRDTTLAAIRAALGT